MTGKLMFVPDTHIIVPKEPNEGQLDIIKDDHNCGATAWEIYTHAIEAAPQLTTPPVLRWEGDFLLCGNKTLDLMYSIGGDGKRWTTVNTFKQFESIEEARRAAEKALGLPEIEEV